MVNIKTHLSDLYNIYTYFIQIRHFRHKLLLFQISPKLKQNNTIIPTFRLCGDASSKMPLCRAYIQLYLSRLMSHSPMSDLSKRTRMQFPRTQPIRNNSKPSLSALHHINYVFGLSSSSYIDGCGF